jgi:glyoxylase-like metal-dependent hydrolase (beta-lactamase superfamily II)
VRTIAEVRADIVSKMPDFSEVADRVWVARYEWADANVTAISGRRGLVVVDTHGSTVAGRIVLDDLGRLGVGRVAHVVNSHWHWDHTFGNAAFREAIRDVPIHAHEQAALWLTERSDRIKQLYADSTDDHRDEIAATEVVIPDQTFSDMHVVDLGDRIIELVFLGRGHTSGDIVVRVPDADAVLVGDLVEESAKPWIGMDSWPLEWPATLDALLELVTERTLVIPGHGIAVDRTYVQTQRDEISNIVEMVRNLAELGIPAERAAAQGEWPWDVDERIHNAITRGYEALSSG